MLDVRVEMLKRGFLYQYLPRIVSMTAQKSKGIVMLCLRLREI